MRKYFYFALCLSASAMFFTTGCKNKTTNPLVDSIFSVDSSSNAEIENDTLKTEIITVDKKHPLSADGEKAITFSANICYPVNEDNSKIAQIIRDWTSKRLAYCTQSGEDKPKLYAGDNKKGKLMTEHYMRTYIKQSKEEINEFVSLNDGASEEDMLLSYEYDIRTSKMYEDNDYITFLSNVYSYAGGAHGSTDIDFLPINKHTNKAIGWTDLFDKKDFNKIMKLVRAKFVKQFKKEWNDDFDDVLILDEEQRKKGLPMPATSPGLSISGVEFLYNQYEIACYAAGVLSVTIPYAELESYLKPEIKAILIK